MQRLREHENHEHDSHALYNSYEQYNPLYCDGTFSVLSPDNRQFLERPRSKSPDMRNKRMIIGQKSFAFGHDGDLIEINPNAKRLFESIPSNDFNVVENSKISNDLGDNNNKILKQTAVEEIEKILLKRLPSDDDTEFNDIDVNLSIQMFEDCKDAQNELNKNVKRCNKDISSNIISANISDIRRASDGFYDMKDGKMSVINKRRYSDGFMQTIDGIDDTTLSRRRKILKRQTTTINDTEAANYLNFCKSDMTQCKGLEYNLNENLCHIYKQKNISTKSIRNIDEKTEFKNGTKNDVYKKCVQK
ncbi:hypothetical protein WN51_13112 [Melipona quadrifasciata]|uniref:Uncharacterized protein n=1 Tax=Melipona quadrifasciata TaxID=166423 RepID=A0A0M9A0I8_9HYME|nr:hypothetical protein WN51_13112 [Melipona quadrifasciata]